MILNKNLILSEAQAITATAISQNVIQWPTNGIMYGDAAATPRNLGPGNPMPILLQVVEAFNTLTSLTITLETSAAADLSSSTVLASSGAIPLATLIIGHRPSFLRYFPDATLLAFIGLRYTVTGTNPTLGKITAAVATEVQTA